MTQALYKKGDLLAWSGFALGSIAGLGQTLGTPSSVVFIPSFEPWVTVFRIAQLPVLILIVLGSALALRSRGRSLWWLLVLSSFLLNGLVGLLATAILFGLREKAAGPVTAHSEKNEETV